MDGCWTEYHAVFHWRAAQPIRVQGTRQGEEFVIPTDTDAEYGSVDGEQIEAVVVSDER